MLRSVSAANRSRSHLAPSAFKDNRSNPKSQVRWLTRKRRKVGLAVIIAVFAGVVAYVCYADRLPWGGRATSCSIKEMRDSGVFLGRGIDTVSQSALSARSPLCYPSSPSNSTRHSDDHVTVAFLIWTYTDDDVRRQYATTTSEVTPLATEECRSWCSIIEAKNQSELHGADLVMLSHSDHGRAFGVTWCRHEYPEPFMQHIKRGRRSQNQHLGRVKSYQGSKQGKDEPFWGAWTFEHLVQFPQLADPLVLNNVDMMMNYHMKADVPVTWFCENEGPPGMRDYYRPMAPIETKEYLVSIVGSRCRNDWAKYVNELDKHLPPGSFQKYGGCWGYQQKIPSIHGSSFADKILELSKSKFVLVFENTKEISDYVSEKLSHALLAGSVPVIWGAPNVEEYLPAPDSAILVTHHGRTVLSPRELARRLIDLHNDDTAYRKFFEWKLRPPNKQFEAQKKMCFQTSGCRLCEWVRKRRNCESNYINRISSQNNVHM